MALRWPSCLAAQVLSIIAVLCMYKCTVAHLTENQLVGEYTALNLIGGPKCPPKLLIQQVEPLPHGASTFFVVPHEFIFLPGYSRARVRCSNSLVPAGSITKFSSTVLRRDSDVKLDRSFEIIDQFVLAQERFFIGFEIGPRVCGSDSVPSRTISMWMAPSPGRVISARIGRNVLTFHSGSKYIYYFDSSRPCLYRANANVKGVIKTVPSPSPSPRPLPSRAPPPSPQPGRPGGGGHGTPGGDNRTGSNEPSRPTAKPGAEFLAPLSSNTPFNNTPVCFPAYAKVQMRNGDLRRIDALQIGQYVRDGSSNYAKIIAFTHAHAHAQAQFVRISTVGNASLTLTPGHFLLLDGVHRPAAMAQVGMQVRNTRGKSDVIAEVKTVMAKGLYNPQTDSGLIVVDGIVCSTYTTAVNTAAAHAMLMPVRFMSACPVRNWSMRIAQVVSWTAEALRRIEGTWHWMSWLGDR